jgi:flavin reductase (DIM6/NTAB) family NADH-FMN oxidoreductase RutF
MDPKELRNAFGTFMTGVTVVTACDPQGAPVGFTANSFTSVSLDPPLVLVCIAYTSRNFETMTGAAAFNINVLCEDQIEVSNTFARPTTDRFAQVDWHKADNGAPLLAGASAWFACARHQIVEAGDHAILIGRVEAYEASERPGLGYARGAYVTPTLELDALRDPLGGTMVSALVEQSGAVLLVPDGQGGQTIPHRRVDGTGVRQTLEALLRDVGLNTHPGFLYSVYDDPSTARQNICFLCHTTDTSPGTGQFNQVDAEVLAAIPDAGVRGVVGRFAQEKQLGRYSIYYGDIEAGEVRHLTSDA